MELSYSALSSLSVTSLLGGNVEHILPSYRRALEVNMLSYVVLIHTMAKLSKKKEVVPLKYNIIFLVFC